MLGQRKNFCKLHGPWLNGDERTMAKDPQGNTVTTHEEKSWGPQGGKKLNVWWESWGDPSAARGGERQQGETAERGGVACADATPAPRNSWAASPRAPTQSVQLTYLTLQTL